MNVTGRLKQERVAGAYAVYLLRWQLSTPLLWSVLHFLDAYHLSPVVAAAVANLIGGLVFFPLDRYIFLHLTMPDARILFQLPLYLGRWQLSSITLGGVIVLMGITAFSVFTANLLGGLVFFWVDRFIFNR